LAFLTFSFVEAQRTRTKSQNKQQPSHQGYILHEINHLPLPFCPHESPEIMENQSGRVFSPYFFSRSPLKLSLIDNQFISSLTKYPFPEIQSSNLIPESILIILSH